MRLSWLGASRARGDVHVAQRLLGGRADLLERLVELRLIDVADHLGDKERRDGVELGADDLAAQAHRLADRRAAAVEAVEHDRVGEIVRAGHGLHAVIRRVQQLVEENRAEHRPSSPRPPLVDVVAGTVRGLAVGFVPG